MNQKSPIIPIQRNVYPHAQRERPENNSQASSWGLHALVLPLGIP